jgi:predicted nucleotidyltransferase
MASQILIRTNQDLHQQLLQEAKEHGLSLNEHCTQRLSIPNSLEAHEYQLPRQVLTAASRLYGDRLLAVLLYGSQARGTAHTESDWDFLFVMQESVPLKRPLYKLWDETFPGFDGQRVEVHFVHLPEKTSLATGFWGELALDALVLFDKTIVVSRHLNRVRREITDGTIVRRTVHGQAYWIHREVA